MALPALGTASPSQAGWVGWRSRAFPKGRVLLASSPWGPKGREGEQDPLPGTAHLVCRRAEPQPCPGTGGDLGGAGGRQGPQRPAPVRIHSFLTVSN